MAATRLTDVIVPAVFTPYVQQETMVLNAFVNSGVIIESPALSNLVNGGGLTFNVPSWKDLADTDANISSDDPGTSSTPQNIGSAQEIAVRSSRNQSWSAMDLAGELAGDDPMRAIAGRVARYWAQQLQKQTLSVVKGILADNAAVPSGADTHTAGDMIFDATGLTTPADLFSSDAFLQAVQTMGDAGDSELRAIAVHSVVYRRMQLLNLIDFIPDARGEIEIPFYLGRRVVVDDALVDAGPVYRTYLFGAGALGLGNGSAKVPTEVDRSPAAGNGGGQDTLYTRTVNTIHPIGHAFIATPAGNTPTNAEYQAATSWSRRYPERKQVPFAMLLSNG